MQQKKTIFEFYRYQIIPTTTKGPVIVGGDELEIDQLVKVKNEIFINTVASRGLTYLDSYSTELLYTILRVDNEENRFFFRIGKQKEIILSNKKLEPVTQLDYPSALVLVDNEPDRQIIAISNEPNAFGSPQVVARILENNFSKFLANSHLQVIISPILEKKEFWNLIKRYESKIEKLEFLLIKPNMSNISQTFREEIRELTDSTNSAMTRVQLNAPRDQTLENINEENPRVNALANYAIQGGAQHIKVKVKGIRKEIKTDQTIVSTTVESVELAGPADEVTRVFNEILNQGDV